MEIYRLGSVGGHMRAEMVGHIVLMEQGCRKSRSLVIA